MTPRSAAVATDRIDAHHHVWDLTARPQEWLVDLPSIDRSFSLDDLAPSLATTGVTGTVLVQVATVTAETEEFLALAADHPVVRGVVGWLDLTAGGVADEVARLRTLPGGDRLVGIRHQVQGEPDPRWLLRDDVLAGLRELASTGLVYDLLVTVDQLPAAVEVVGLVPDLVFVLDHLGKPRVAAAELDPWRQQVAALAAHPNVAAKLSGLLTEAGPTWSVDTLRPYAAHLLSCFGAARVMAGSDWPVSLLAADYPEVTRVTEALLDGLSDSERVDVLGGVATRTYDLRPSPTPVNGAGG